MQQPPSPAPENNIPRPMTPSPSLAVASIPLPALRKTNSAGYSDLPTEAVVQRPVHVELSHSNHQSETFLLLLQLH